MQHTGRQARLRVALVAGVLGAGVALSAAPAASADAVSPSPSDFSLCPVNFSSAQVTNDYFQGEGECVHSYTSGGSIQLGNSNVPIAKNPDTVDFGEYFLPSGANQQAIVTPTNGQMFGGPAQTVPGGLLGLMCPSGVPVVSALCQEATSDPKLAGVDASLVLAGPSTPATVLDPTATTYWSDTSGDPQILRIPVKVHLQNVLLGGGCYIGTDQHPIVWNLNATKFGVLSAFDEFNVIGDVGQELQDTTFAAPGASGCGGLLAPAVDAAIDLKQGLPSPSGKNAVTIDDDSEISTICYAQGTC